LALHPDKGGEIQLFQRFRNLIKEDSFGLKSGSGKSRKCRKCGLYKL
jgi:hypothetical protein